MPIVLALAVIGSYALAQNIAGPITLAVFAVIGWLMQRFDYPVAAAVVGLLLGRLTEGALLRTYQMSGGDIGFLLTRPIALAMLLLLIGSIVLPYLRRGASRSAGKAREGSSRMKRRQLLDWRGGARRVASCVPAHAAGLAAPSCHYLVPFDVGGSADRLARGFAQYMPKYLGQPHDSGRSCGCRRPDRH